MEHLRPVNSTVSSLPGVMGLVALKASFVECLRPWGFACFPADSKVSTSVLGGLCIDLGLGDGISSKPKGPSP